MKRRHFPRGTPEFWVRMSVIRRTSEKFKDGHRRRKMKIKRTEPLAATSANWASRKLQQMGLDKQESPQLWNLYRAHFLQRKQGDLEHPDYC